MNTQNNVVAEGLLFEKVLAHLYVDLLPGDGSKAARARVQDTLAPIDKSFAIQRPSPEELSTWAQQRREVDTEIKGDMAYRVLEEIIAFSQEKFGADWTDELHSRIEALFVTLLKENKGTLSEKERARTLTAILNDILGLGPLEPLLADGSVAEVMVDGPAKIYLERYGKFEDVGQRFRDEAHLMSVIHRIIAPLGPQLNESHPMVDARMPDGSRVNIIIPPISLIGPAITIRKFFSKHRLTLEDLIRFGTFSEEIATFLSACVQSRLNILVSGSTGGGKTSLLNVLADMIPDDERIITIENAAELSLSQTKKRVVTLESRPSNVEGQGEVSIRDLLINALRMRPDRIIVGETRGAEALDLIQAMNTGHDGCLTTLHAVAPPDALQRLETMVAHHPISLPVLAIRKMIANAVDVIVQIDRMPDGSRKVTNVAEVLKLEGNVIMLQDIFQFKATGQEGEYITGRYLPTGIIPQFLARIQAKGIDLPLNMFTPK